MNKLRFLFQHIKLGSLRLVDMVRKSLRLTMVAIFLLCMIAALFTFATLSNFFQEKVQYVSFESSIQNLESQVLSLQEWAQEEDGQGKQLIRDYIERNLEDNRVWIVDENGKVLAHSEKVSNTSIDMLQIIREATSTQQQLIRHEGGEFVRFFPLTWNGEEGFLIFKGNTTPSMETYQSYKNPLPAFLGSILVFMLLFFFFTKGKMKLIEELSTGIESMAAGDLTQQVQVQGEDELAVLATNFNNMASKLRKSLEEERLAEQTKSELISNVSHDLRTPLTSIIGYLKLVEDEKYKNDEERNKYIGIVSTKSQQLARLVEDLFTYTKLSNNAKKMNKLNLSFTSLIEQVTEELVPAAEDFDVTIEKDIPSQNLFVNMDPDEMVRVLENLLMNAIQHSLKPGDIYVRISQEGESVRLQIENNGTLSKEQCERLFDRFYKVDEARSNQNGSGLGLAISKSIVKLHDGDIWAECDENRIRFIVELPLVNEV